MRRIDALFLKYPFYGARQMVPHLRREGVRIGRRRAARPMRLLGLQAVYRAPRTSASHPEHRVYPYLWIGFYNTERPHSALGGRTPAEAYRGDTPVDTMDKPLRALPTSPQAQQQQQKDRFKGILAA